MTDGAYEEIGHDAEDGPTDAYTVSGASSSPCPTCSAEPHQKCRNSITGLEKHIPCLARLVGGGDAA